MSRLMHTDEVVRERRASTTPRPGTRRGGWAWRWEETVNLLWPDDRSWFVLSEIDFDSTVIGCSDAHAERILASSLETALLPGDSLLAHGADTINS